MKTTIDLPEELVLQAKMVALSRKTTLRSLVLQGLKREILNPTSEMLSPIRTLQNLDSGLWADIPADQYVETLREDWT